MSRQILPIVTEFFTDSILPLFSKAIREIIREELQRCSYHQPIKSTSDDGLLSAKESAEFLGDALQTFYGRTSRGEINTYGPPGRIYCKKSELIAFKEKKRSRSKDAIQVEVDSFLAEQGNKRSRR